MTLISQIRCHSVVRGLGTADRASDAGVRAEQINRAVLVTSARDQRLDVGVLAHVGGDRESADLLRHGCRGPFVHVGHDHAAGALGGEPARQRPADAAAGAGHHDVTVGHFHAADNT